MQAQFDHLAETYFGGYEFDLGEREHGMALSCDHDFEMFAAAVGYVKTYVEAILKDEGENIESCTSCSSDICADVELDLGELEPDTVFFQPLQKLLDQSRSARVLSK